MTIHVLGSINIDHVHRLPRMPAPGETLADLGYSRGLGGKGANQALAAAAAGAEVRMIGAVGADGLWAAEAILEGGVGIAGIATVAEATGHAAIWVLPGGENVIVIHGGANRAIDRAAVAAGLAEARPGDWWLAQNETSMVAESLGLARAAGLRTAYAAAPFEPADAAEALPLADLVAVNETEAAALAAHLGLGVDAIPAPMLLVTRGGGGARLTAEGGRLLAEQPAFPVEAVDTTGAGDCFLGTLLAGLDAGLEPSGAMARAAAAAAISVTRAGAAAAIPTRAEVDALLAGRGR